MSTDSSGGGATNDSSQSGEHAGGQNQQVGGADDVAGLLKHKDKLLGENKKLKAEMADLRSLVERGNTDKLEAEGKKDELIQKLKSEREELTKKVVTTHSTFAMRVISGELKAEAAKNGCVALDDFIRLVDLSEIEVDDSYQPDPEKVKLIVQESIKTKPYLFSKQAPKINNGFPGAEQKESTGTDLTNLSSKQLLEMAHKLARQKGK